MAEHRRRDDPRISTLVDDVALLKAQVKENTDVTVQVRDMLAGFRVAAAIAKWVTVVSAAVGGSYAALRAGWDFHHK